VRNYSLKRFLKDERAQGTVEYVIIAAALTLVGFAAIKGFRGALAAQFNSIAKSRAGKGGVAP